MSFFKKVVQIIIRIPFSIQETFNEFSLYAHNRGLGGLGTAFAMECAQRDTTCCWLTGILTGMPS